MSVARVLWGGIGVVATVAAIGAVPAAPAGASTSPAQAVSAALSGAQKQSSVRWASSVTTQGITNTIVTQAGRSQGSQLITWSEGKNAAYLAIELVNGVGYMTGTAGGLYAEGFTQTAAASEAGKWISLTSSSSAYASTVSGLTIATTMEQMQMAGPVTSVPAVTISGHRYPGYKGTTKPYQGGPALQETIYLSTTATPLPVKAVQDTSTVVFGDWGEAVKVSVPKGAVAVQSGWLRK
ncbi:MAG TPA: hypothetical protein VEJ84_02875 [Acidimicrobiales bacterium]|nr:hypothetical protein [Acidimicrobiales bacterium]